MASIRKHRQGWRAEVQRRGVRRSKVLPTKREAQDWAARAEYEILNAPEIASATPLGDVLDRYAREVSPTKRGHRWEVVRLEKLQRDKIARLAMRDLRPQDLAEWRDRRLREVGAGTVRREMALLSGVFSQARREWGMIATSPLEGVRKPPEPARRSRRVSAGEFERLAHAAGSDLNKATARAYHAFLFSIETAMRAGEVIRLRPGDVDLNRRVVRLATSKNGEARAVPLSTEAVRLLGALPEGDPVFGLRSDQLDALWRKVRDRAAVEDLTFHDSRHEAITRLSKRLDPLALARVVGHKDIRQLMTYYDETAEDLAKRLD